MQPPAPLLDAAPRHLFFTGKGGVGKTSLACATALRLAAAGRRVLLISTDPASNLDEILGTPLDRSPRAVPGAPGLEALNIHPLESARAYREKVLAPLRGILPEAALRSVEEQLSGACTTEIAAFDEFTAYLSHPTPHDHLVFDTAPTGHTLRLLGLSQAWTGFLDQSKNGASCLGPLAGLDKQREVYRRAVETLADPARTLVVLVARPQDAPLREAARAFGELRAIGIGRQILILNGLFTASDPTDPVARGLERRAERALATHRGFLASLPTAGTPLRHHQLVGLEALRSVFHTNPPPAADRSTLHEGPEAFPNEPEAPSLPSLGDLVDELAAAGRGVILTMGKGGVGKTTLAAAIAHALAARGHRVHLSTTDPAAHVAEAAGEAVHGLDLGRIDPAAETAAYTAQVLAEQGASLDEVGRALLEEDLRSPCTEEIAVFRAFARTVARGGEGFVVLDTAPTGHTLLLLDATEAYHRELGRQTRGTAPEDVRSLLARLRDPSHTRVLLVTLAEATPVHEAADLQEDLRRAGIEPHAWIINQSLAAAGVTDPLLRARAAQEQRYIAEVAGRHARHTVLAAFQPGEPTGRAGLEALLTLQSPACH